MSGPYSSLPFTSASNAKHYYDRLGKGGGMSLLSGLVKGLGSVVSAPFKAIKSIGNIPGSVLDLVKGGGKAVAGGVTDLLSSVHKLVPKLLPIAASMAPMAVGLPPMPGLANLFAPQQQATPQNLATHVLPNMGQAAFAGMPASGIGMDPRYALTNLGGPPSGVLGNMSLLRLMGGLQGA